MDDISMEYRFEKSIDCQQGAVRAVRFSGKLKIKFCNFYS